jgi:hypothetical protein
MNTINPQVTSSGVQRSDTRGGERTESNSVPADMNNGKGLPQVEAKDVAKGKEGASEVAAKDPLVDAVATTTFKRCSEILCSRSMRRAASP